MGKVAIYMFSKFKIWLQKKTDMTIFGQAYNSLSYLLTSNKIAFTIEMLITFLISILISGRIMLGIMNLFGENYSVTLWNCFAAWLGKGGIVFSLVVFVFVQVMIGRFIRRFAKSSRHEDERNINISTEGTYGTASIMSDEVMKETFVMDTLKNNKNTIFGKYKKNPNIIVSQKHPLLKVNRNVLMIAGPSAGKSATFVIPLLFQIMRRGESAIVSDPKSELFKICSELAKKLGYEVRIMNLNPLYLGNSDPCNFLQYVGDDIDKAQVMSTAIINNTTDAADVKDFWTEGAVNLLQAVMLYINIGNTFRPSEKNLPYLFEWLVGNDNDTIDNTFLSLPNEHPAKAPALIFVGGDDKVKKQTLQGLRIKLKLFNSPKLRKILSKTEGGIDIINPGRKKCMYFVGSSDQDSSMDPIVSLFYTLVYQELVRYADMRKDQQLPITVHMVLDEYANMGTIPDFEKRLSTVRSRNIVTYIILQDINQLKKKHPLDSYKTVINDCDYFLLEKTNDIDTMTWWSEMCGSMTVEDVNARYSMDKSDALDLHNEETKTQTKTQRKTYNPDEIRKLGEHEILVLVTQRDPIKLDTFFWKTDHPYAKHVVEVLPSQHYPLWRLIEDGIVSPDFDYDNEPSYVMEIPEDEMVEINPSYDPDQILKEFHKNEEGKQLKKVNLASIKNTGKTVIKKISSSPKGGEEKKMESQNETVVKEEKDDNKIKVRIIKPPVEHQQKPKSDIHYVQKSKPQYTVPSQSTLNNFFSEEKEERASSTKDPHPSSKQNVSRQNEPSKVDDDDHIFEEFEDFEEFDI